MNNTPDPERQSQKDNSWIAILNDRIQRLINLRKEAMDVRLRKFVAKALKVLSLIDIHNRQSLSENENITKPYHQKVEKPDQLIPFPVSHNVFNVTDPLKEARPECVPDEFESSGALLFDILVNQLESPPIAAQRKPGEKPGMTAFHFLPLNQGIRYFFRRKGIEPNALASRTNCWEELFRTGCCKNE